MKRYTLVFLLLSCIFIHKGQCSLASNSLKTSRISNKLYNLYAIIKSDTLSTIVNNPEISRLGALDSTLSMLVKRDSTYAKEVDVTTEGLPLAELLRNIARVSGVNLSVRSVENIPVSCNFVRARVDDLIRFLCREYHLDIIALGNIVSIFPAAVVPAPQPEPDVGYNMSDTTLYYNLRDESLIDVAKKIGQLTDHNIIVAKSLYDYKVSGYVKRMHLAEAIQTLAEINGLQVEQKSSKIWTFFSRDVRFRKDSIKTLLCPA